MLINGAKALDHARCMRGKDVTGEMRIDWPELMGFKRSFTDPVPEKQEHRYADKGIDTYHGRVDLSEAQAREQGLKFSLKSEQASGWFTARQAAEPVYGFKVLVEEESGRVLGAHLVGPNVDEVINLFALAIRHGLTADEIKSTMFAYPTGASDIGYMV
jgi:pyruvate/2-oxoglutarate dehydrogenase complex dihydrolipoamide dehydrogenase (E3) component